MSSASKNPTRRYVNRTTVGEQGLMIDSTVASFTGWRHHLCSFSRKAGRAPSPTLLTRTLGAGLATAAQRLPGKPIEPSPFVRPRRRADYANSEPRASPRSRSAVEEARCGAPKLFRFKAQRPRPDLHVERGGLRKFSAIYSAETA